MKPVKLTKILCYGWVVILVTVLVCQVHGAAVLDIADPDNPPSATQETVGWRMSGNFPYNLTVRLRILAGENRQIVSTTVKWIELDTSVHSELNDSLPASYYKTWTPSNNKDYRVSFQAISWHYGSYRIEGSYTWRQMPGGQTGTVSATPLNIMLQPYFPQNVKSHYRPPDDYIKHVPTAHQDMGVDYYVFGYEYQDPSRNWVPMEVKFYNLDGSELYTFPPHDYNPPNQHQHLVNHNIEDVTPPLNAWYGLYTMKVKTLLPGMSQWQVSDKSKFLTIGNSPTIEIINSEVNRNVTAKISYTLEDTANKAASLVVAEAFNPELASIATTSPMPSSPLQGVTSQLKTIDFNAGYAGFWPLMISAKDDHAADDKEHKQRYALQKGQYWPVYPAVCFGADLTVGFLAPVDTRSWAQNAYDWLGVVRKPANMGPNPKPYDLYFPYSGWKVLGVDGGVIQAPTKAKAIETLCNSSYFYWAGHSVGEREPYDPLAEQLWAGIYLTRTEILTDADIAPLNLNGWLAIFVGCETADDSQSITGKSIAHRVQENGYHATVGFMEHIGMYYQNTPDFTVVDNWSRAFHEALCYEGKNVIDARGRALEILQDPERCGYSYYYLALQGITSASYYGDGYATLWW